MTKSSNDGQGKNHAASAPASAPAAAPATDASAAATAGLNIPQFGATVGTPQPETQAEAPRHAAHNPAILRHAQEMESTAPKQSVSLADLQKEMDRKDRSDLVLEPVSDLYRWKDKAEELAFLEELVIINIFNDASPDAENPVQLGINGRMVIVWRGDPTVIRRKYVEQLLRAKPQRVTTRLDRSNPDNVKNFADKTSSLKYPFEIVQDDNPRGRAWAKKILSEV
jgi:hypothetical protein